ncbi:MAG: serine hydrolase domain-containing protein [Myxococcota bacterium]
MKRLLALALWCLTGCGVDIGPETFSGASVERSDDALASALMRGLERFGDEDGFSGSVGVSRRGTIVFAAGTGLCEVEPRRECDADTVFPIGSITKPMTATAVVALEAEERLAFDDTLVDFLPDIDLSKRNITIEQLLTHTSGFVDSIGDDEEAIEWPEFQRRSAATDLEDSPGVAYRYSNVGYSYLGRIVELVNPDGYEAYLRTRFFDPADMDRTGYVLPVWDGVPFAIGYRDHDLERRWGTILDEPWAEDGPFWNLRGNGGVLSTVNDMLSWQRSLPDDALPEPSLERMLSPLVDEGGGDTFYGYGWTVMDTDVGRVAWHDGGNDIFYAVVFWFREADTFFVGLTNASSNKRTRALLDLARIAVGLEPDR